LGIGSVPLFFQGSQVRQHTSIFTTQEDARNLIDHSQN